jgi:ATP-dependent RNA helicase RhlE
MLKAGIKAAAIHGNKGRARTKALAGFKDGTLTALVATDIAAWTRHTVITACCQF